VVFQVEVPLPLKTSLIEIDDMSQFRTRHMTVNGFSLVELMVSIGLLAFLGILAASTFDYRSWLANYRLKAAVRNLEMNFQFARMEATKRNTYCILIFNLPDPCPDPCPESCPEPCSGAPYDYVVVADANNNRRYDCSSCGDPSCEKILRKVKFSCQYKGVRLDTTQSDDGLTFANNLDGFPAITFNSMGLPQGQIGSAYLCDDRGNRLKVTVSMTGRIKTEPY
jgi:Tfp pilus assembly protein FimT